MQEKVFDVKRVCAYWINKNFERLLNQYSSSDVNLVSIFSEVSVPKRIMSFISSI